MNSQLQQIEPSLIREIDRKKKTSSIDLGLGAPLLKPSLLPLQQAFAWIEKYGCPYSPNAGFEELRSLIASYYHFPGMETSHSVCVTVGSQEGLHVAIKSLVTPYKDEVLLVCPTYPLYKKLCLMEGLTVNEVQLDPLRGFLPDAQKVLNAITPKTRLIILGSPSNPTGQIWSKEELQTLSAGLLQRKDPIYLLSDEVYREIYFTEDRPPSPAEYYPFTVVASSLSKSCALPGLRLGFLVALPEMMTVMWKVHQFAVSCTDTFAQRVAIEIFKNPLSLSAHRQHYLNVWKQLSLFLAKTNLSYISPKGSFYTMIQLPESVQKESLAIAFRLLEEEDVVTIPGVAFSAEGFLRTSFVAPLPLLEKAFSKIDGFFKQYL